ncbi:LCP family protein [Patescibacteria group bacterium]|nr:LCP family protein [Patescibacteria group bacterium]
MPWKKSIFVFGLVLLILGLLIFALTFLLQPKSGRTSFLILGIAGENYSGDDLTDSMIFLSTENQTGKTLVLSLPRDIWVAPLRAKLNTVYHYQGLAETEKIVEEILGQKVDYGILIDFKLFTQLVDFLGGVEVEVERTFDDFKYPIAGKENDLCEGDPEYQCRYEHLHFEAGRQNMDGATALKYVRSRNAEGEEGTDFARSQRQQRLLLAIQKKIFTPKVMLNPWQTWPLIKITLANIKTDIPSSDYWNLIKTALKWRKANFRMLVLNDGYLINPPTSQQRYDNQWVLIPKSGNWQEIHEYLKKLLIF